MSAAPSLDRSGLTEVEKGISPRMRKAVTLPVKFGRARSPIVVYVAVSAFTAEPVSDEQLIEVARRLDLHVEDL